VNLLRGIGSGRPPAILAFYPKAEPMPATETAIFLPTDLLERIDELARELGLSRNDVIVRAVEELAHHRESIELRARLDRAHADDQPSPHAELRRAKHRDLVEGEW
jgi:predicted transcriptional regulator